MTDAETEAPPIPGEDTPSTEIVRHIEHVPVRIASAGLMTDDEMRRTWRMASALAASKMFKDSTQAEQAFAKILIGRDLGISATRALTGIDLVEGNVQMRGVLLAAFIRESGRYDYRKIESTPERAVIEFRRAIGDKWIVEGETEFTIQEAREAGLIKPRSAWEKYPRNMLWWRAMSNGVKMYAPDLLGGIPVYTEADSFEDRTLSAGEGSGEAQGIDLGPAVEEVMARAQSLGHAAFSDRATVEMQLGDQPPGYVQKWVQEASAELDAMEPAEAEVVDPNQDELPL